MSDGTEERERKCEGREEDIREGGKLGKDRKGRAVTKKKETRN